MEDLSMFQRPRSVALEYEKPGTYGTVLIYPLDRLIRELRINLVATPRAGASSKWRRCRELNVCADFDLDLELERTLRRARQVRRRIEFENSLYSQAENLAAEEISVDSSLSDSDSEQLGTLRRQSPMPRRQKYTLRAHTQTQCLGTISPRLGVILHSELSSKQQPRPSVGIKIFSKQQPCPTSDIHA
ncbi:hypothetical protein PIB30_078072 [Stylosanthes scabra]|uniref:Uncharacterized protein n=1 Tax=Stylosanthes scabra TaxID=79078 RepID=A0ABU6WTW8_9FABA|nr:hypothetical protein [Stylosanthes scabra]